MLQRNYLNSRPSITVNRIQYFNVHFHRKEKFLFMSFELHKGAYSKFLKKECFFLDSLYRNPLVKT